MQYDYVEQLTKAGKTSYESLQELGAINAKALQKIAELQFKFASFNIETGIEQSKLLASTSNYKDLLSAESDFAGEYSTKAMDFTRQAATIITESRDEFVNWLEKGISNADITAKAPATKRSSKKTSD